MLAVGITFAAYGSVALIAKRTISTTGGRGTAKATASRVPSAGHRVRHAELPHRADDRPDRGMICVGDSIMAHGLHGFGIHWLGDVIHDLSVSSGTASGGVAGWSVETLGYALAAIVDRAIAIPVVGGGISAALNRCQDGTAGREATTDIGRRYNRPRTIPIVRFRIAIVPAASTQSRDVNKQPRSDLDTNQSVTQALTHRDYD
jgi:hypothetical protein